MSAAWGLRGEPHSVYRCYTDRGVLLYVGCTSNVEQRLRQHRTKSVWFDEMARYTTTEYRNFYDARAAEDDAIYRERPVFNRNGGGKLRREAEAQRKQFAKWENLDAVSLEQQVLRDQRKLDRLNEQLDVVREVHDVMRERGFRNAGEALDYMNEVNA